MAAGGSGSRPSAVDGCTVSAGSMSIQAMVNGLTLGKLCVNLVEESHSIHSGSGKLDIDVAIFGPDFYAVYTFGAYHD